jgi:glycosyltransferase involved in cell wall biosynthesis
MGRRQQYIVGAKTDVIVMHIITPKGRDDQSRSLQGSTAEKPFLTVVTVVLNRREYLERTIKSVVEQTFKGIEYIIMDGGSTDGTKEVLEKYRDRISLWNSEPDKGIYDAMNKGMRAATGEWLHFLNAGDVFYRQDTVERVFSSPYGTAGMLYGDQEVVFDADCSVIKRALPLKDIWKGMVFNHQSLFTKTELLREHPFQLSYRIAADYEFIYFSFRKGVGFYYLGFPISSVALGGLSDMNVGAHMREQWQIARTYRDTPAVNIYYRYAMAVANFKKVLKAWLPRNMKAALVRYKYR